MIVEIREPPFFMRFNIQTIGSAGTRDPLDQHSFINFEVMYNRFRKVYRENFTVYSLASDEYLEATIHSFFQNINRQSVISNFFHEAELEEQRREGYYRGIDSSHTELY